MARLRWHKMYPMGSKIMQVQSANLMGKMYLVQQREVVEEDGTKGYFWELFFGTRADHMLGRARNMWPSVDLESAKRFCEWHAERMWPTWIGRIETMRQNQAVARRVQFLMRDTS